MHRRRHTVSAWGNSVQERQDKRLRRNATEHIVPSSFPCPRCFRLQLLWKVPDFRQGQLLDKLDSLCDPPPTKLCGQHQFGSSSFSNKFRVRPLFCVCAHSPTQPLVFVTLLAAHCRLCGGGETIAVSMARCAPAKSGKRSATTSKRLAWKLLCVSTSMSRTKTFVLTRAPASRQTLAPTDSNAQPLRPYTSADAHAARWWPRASSGRHHQQRRIDRGRGRPWRRRSKRRNGCESNLVVGSAQKLTNGVLAGPVPESAMSSSKKRISALRAACFCHPMRGRHGSSPFWL